MQKALIAIGLVLLSACLYYLLQKQTMNTAASVPEIIPIEHATAVITWADTVFYTDPVGGKEAFDGQPAPQIILLTDIHGDHLNAETLTALASEKVTILAPRAVIEQLPATGATIVPIGNGEKRELFGFTIEAIPMYNVPESEDAKHTKGRGNGYVVERYGYRLYISGDTANTPELRGLKNIDWALLCMNLPFTMGVEEAAEATLAFKPKRVTPYHYRGTEGLSDIEKFKALVNAGDPSIEVLLMDWYTQQ